MQWQGTSIVSHLKMTSPKARSAVIDWERLKQHGVHPSFSLPSSYNAVRAHVPPSSIREVCAKHPRHEYSHLCDREAVVIPVLLARPEGTNLDTQVYRAHVQNSRRYLGTSGSFSFKDTAEGRQLRCKDASGVGTPKVDLKSSWQDLLDALWPKTFLDGMLPICCHMLPYIYSRGSVFFSLCLDFPSTSLESESSGEALNDINHQESRVALKDFVCMGMSCSHLL